MPRYFPGRNILVKTTVNPDHDSPDYMSYSTTETEKLVTHRATLVGYDAAAKTFSVEVDGKNDGPLQVPVNETLVLN